MLDQSVLLQWERVLGPEHVVTEASRLNQASTATFHSTQRIPAILYPKTRDEVQDCLRVASENGIPVYPVSTGKNWGYGSRVPASTDCVLIDMSRMNRILDFDENLAYATVEPGVTQRQLFDYLREKRSKLWIDATGSTPDSSLIGNTVERGFGHTPYGDHASNVCGFEVVLPNGDCIETGFSRFANAAAAHVYRPGLGPSLDGLFTQSESRRDHQDDFVVDAGAGIFSGLLFSMRSRERTARNHQCPAASTAEWNTDEARFTSATIIRFSRAFSSIRDATGGATPLTPAVMKKLRKTMRFGAWNGSGGLYGTRAQVAEARRLVKRSLKGVADQVQFLDASRLALASRMGASRMAGPFHAISKWDLRRTLELVRPLFGLMQGVPTDQPLASVYWRKRTPPPAEMDPDRDGCGLMWYSPVAPWKDLMRLLWRIFVGYSSAVRLRADAFDHAEYGPFHHLRHFADLRS